MNLAGGILLFIIALRMIFPHPGDPVNEQVEDPSIVPLAMPMIAGPWTITVAAVVDSVLAQRG